MKKLIIVVGLLAAIGGAAYFLLCRGPNGKPPALAATLPAAHTVGAVGVSDLTALVKAFDKAGANLPKDQLGELAMAFDPKQRTEALGFDPATADGWASIGVDATAGFVVTMDARVTAKGEPLGILLAKVSDEAKLVEFVKKRSGEAVEIADGELKIGGKGAPYGTRGDYKALLLSSPSRVAEGLPGFKAFLADSSSIGGDEAFKDAFREAVEPPLVFAYGGLEGAQPLAKALGVPKEVVEGMAFYKTLFPAMGLSGDSKASRVRVVATEKGVQILKKFFVPSKGAPKFSKYVPATGWGAFRVSVNLKDLLSGVTDVLPPSVPAEDRNKVGMITMMLPMLAGFTWEDLTAAFSGHFVFAVDVTSVKALEGGDISALKGLLMISVGDEGKADSLLKQLIDLAAKGAKVAPIEVAGAKGYVLEIAGQRPVVVRDGDVVLAGPSEAAIKAAIETAKGKNLSGHAAAEALDGDMFYAAAYDVESMAKALGDRPEAQVLQAFKGLGIVHGGFVVDGDGVLGEAAMMGADALMGVVVAGMVSYFTLRDGSGSPPAEDAVRPLEAPPAEAPPIVVPEP